MGFDHKHEELLQIQNRMKRYKVKNMDHSVKAVANAASLLMGMVAVGLAGLMFV